MSVIFSSARMSNCAQVSLFSSSALTWEVEFSSVGTEWRWPEWCALEEEADAARPPPLLGRPGRPPPPLPPEEASVEPRR